MNNYEKIKNAKNIDEMVDLLPFREEYCNVCYFEDFCEKRGKTVDDCFEVLKIWLQEESE